MSRLRLGLILVGLTVATPALAQPSAPPPPPPPPTSGPAYAGPSYAPAPDLEYHAHRGFYLRIFTGVGYTSMSMSGNGGDGKVHGSGGTFGLAAGGALANDLIIYGEVFDDVATSPTVELNGSSSATSQDTAAGVVGFGAGLAKYFPSNIYVSGTVSAARLTIQEQGVERGRSEFGLGVSAMVGKEWWVSANWGLGVALQAFMGRMKDNPDAGAPTWTSGAFALAFSATYN